MTKRHLFILAIGAFSLLSNVYAEEGKDDFLDVIEGSNTVKLEKADKQPKKEVVKARKVFSNLNDPFERLLFARVETAKETSYDFRTWVDHVFAGEYAQAAHLWTSIQNQIPENLMDSAKGAYFYSLWHLNIPQTFFNQWMGELGKASYKNSPSEIALEKSMTSDSERNFDNFLIDNAIILTPFQEEIISQLEANRPVAHALKAYALQRKGEKAESMIASLPKNSKLRMRLSQTAALAHAQRKDLVGAAKIVKGEIETIEALKSPHLLSEHYLAIARLLYAAGKLKNAQSYYEKIPNTSPQYVAAREELTWTLLRLGENSQLRGELESLTQGVFKDRFAPDVYLVSAISNLKMCYYDKVQKNLEDFSKINSAWALKIDKALAQSTPPAPRVSDTFSKLASQSVENISKEKTRLEKLAKESIEATLPAVGVQKHWRDAEKELEAALNLAKQKESAEFRRQWVNDRTVLSEVIRKMRFVKIEYLSQVQKLSGETFKTVDAPKSTITKNSSQMIFPVDEVLWPDELFRMRSLAQSHCLAKNGVQK